MVKDHLGITFRVRVSGWMVGWMDGWINRSITKHTLTSIHRSILHLPDHSNMPNLQIRIYHSGRLFWAPGEGSSTTTPSGVIGDCETVQFCVFSPHFFRPMERKQWKKQLRRPMICMYVHIYIYMPSCPLHFLFSCVSRLTSHGVLHVFVRSFYVPRGSLRKRSIS